MILSLILSQGLFCLTPDAPLMAKMWKNSRKACEEHQNKSSLKNSFMAMEKIPSPMEYSPLASSLFFLYQHAEAQGKRESMEDAHFYKEGAEGIILGVLDGHGGKEVAQFVSTAFPERFFDKLQSTEFDICQTFYELFEEIHTEILAKHPKWRSGTTAVISFIDPTYQSVFTATLGDSESNLYRKDEEGNIKSIPLSCIRDWSHVKERKRAALGMGLTVENYVALEEKKQAQYGSQYKFRFALMDAKKFSERSINVSRAIGDRDFCLLKDGVSAGVIQKPKITVHSFQKRDILILACDGLKDYVDEATIVSILKEAPAKKIASSLVDYAIHKAGSEDNVTVVALRVL